MCLYLSAYFFYVGMITERVEDVLQDR